MSTHHDISIKIVENLTIMQSLWLYFYQPMTVWGCWDFRLFCHQSSQENPRFYTAFDHDIPVAMVPIAWTKRNARWEYFGEPIMENNFLFCTPGYETTLERILEQLPTSISLEYLQLQTPHIPKHCIRIEDKFMLDLSRYTSLEDYYQDRLRGESRRKFKKKVQEVELSGITVVENKLEDLKHMFQWNINKFEHADGSSFLIPGRQELLEYVAANRTPVRSHLYSFYLNQVLQGATLNFEYAGYWYIVNTGFSPSAHEHIQTYYNIYSIAAAIQHKCQTYDAGSGSFGWKERLHMEPTPQYNVIK